jgi:cytochrome b pre-mRNA-processing protein 3
VILRWILGPKPNGLSTSLYAAIVAAARQEKFYADWHVPDTMDGRFEILSLHMFLVLDRLRDFGAEGEALAQDLTDRFFDDMDASLREAGVGDLSVGKKVRKMAEAFYGRATAYRTSLAGNGQGLPDALKRNVYAGAEAPHVAALAAWVKQACNTLSQQSFGDFSAGSIVLP